MSDSYVLNKHAGNPPSLVVHLHPTHFRFDGQDGMFPYKSPMKLFLEHVRSEGWQARVQEGLTPCCQHIAGGCQLDRNTPEWFVSNPDFRVEALQRVPVGVPPVSPILRGRAVRE